MDLILSPQNAILAISQNERRSHMSANLYNVQSLLVGKEYLSKTMRGEIISAEKHPQPVWYDGAEAYLVEIAPYSGSNTWGRKTYRTVCVSVG